MATLAPTRTREEAFWPRMTIGISIFILFGFAQFAARGMVNYAAVPAYVHLHAVVMVGWLAFMVMQPTLIQREALKRITQRFRDKGIAFASSSVTVQTVAGSTVTEDSVKLAAMGGAAAKAGMAPENGGCISNEGGLTEIR